MLYCDDEASADESGKTIQEKFETGEYSTRNVEDEFDMWVAWLDLSDYDIE